MAIALANSASHSDPMSEMNTTPLIDVMLVLLIMFIITIPVATHSVPIDLPGNRTDPGILVDTIKNKIVLTAANQTLWNGTEVNNGELGALLHRSVGMNPEPELQFEPEAQASYDLSAKVLGQIKLSGVTRFGFVGNEHFAEFGKPAGLNK